LGLFELIWIKGIFLKTPKANKTQHTKIYATDPAMQRLTIYPQIILFAASWAWAAAMALAANGSETHQRRAAPAAFSGWLDPLSKATINSVEQEASWEPFTGWKGWAFGPEPVWLQVHIPAVVDSKADPFVLVVRPPFLDQIEFFDPTYKTNLRLGDYFPAKDDALGSVLFSFKVPAHSDDRYVFLRLQSTSTRIAHLSLMAQPEAQAYSRSVEWVTGSVLMLSLVFWLWATAQWWFSHEKIMGIFAVKQAFITLWGFLLLGFARVTVGPLFAEGLLSLISSLVVAGVVAATFWFFSALLKDYAARPWMLRVLRIAAAGTAGLSLLSLAGFTQQSLQIINAIGPLGLLWIVISLLSAPSHQQKPLISKGVLLGYLSMYALLNSIPPLTYLGLLGESNILFIGNMTLLVMDGLIMLIILNVRQRRFKEQHQAIATKLLLQEEQARLDQEYLEEQRKLLAMLAHEMKTPLANLRIWMEAGPKGRPVMERAILDMDRVIERCVHAGQLSDHSLQPRNEWLDAAELTQSVVAASRAPGRVNLQLPPDICAVNTDLQMLSIVLSNVLENAYKYSAPDTSIQVELASHTEPNGKPCWRWTVENMVGEAGFPDADKVFDKYYRAANAQRQSGSGLGLFLVKSLLDLMQGKVIYTPLIDRVRFEIWIPSDTKKNQ
jgi:signal transduction histidine kinase